MKIRLLFLLFLLTAFCNTTFAGISCDLATLQAAVDAAARGATITCNAGSWVWGSSLSITKGLTLLGAGIGNTVITSGGTLLNIVPDSTAQGTEQIRIDGFTFDGNNTASPLVWVTESLYAGFIVGHNKFQNGPGDTLYIRGQVRGVIYDNIFDRIQYPIRVFGYGALSEWTAPYLVPFSYGSSDNLYFEHNTIMWSSSMTTPTPGWIETGQSGRLVVRFNSYDSANSVPTEYFDQHGFQGWLGTAGSGETGDMLVEYYRNTFVNANGSINGLRWVNHRGSWGMYFDNTLTGSTNWVIAIDQYATEDIGMGGSGCSADIVPTPSGYIPEVNNTYIFNNKSNGNEELMIQGPIGDGCGVSENNYPLGYWNYNTSFNGTVGVGRGVRASRPATCTTGVAYWSTDQGSWNQSGSGAQGVLDKCTATNTWTDNWFVPYTYPHPLASGNTPTATVTQSGYRWRNDNGSESTATWKAAQNTSTSVDKNTAIRLRTQLNGTVDPASAAYQLEYKLSTDSTYKVVPLPASQQVTTVTATGSGTFTGPADTTTAQIQCWGAGAAGGRAIEDNKSGAGGGGGGYAVRTAIGLTEGTSYSYSVGAGGTDGTSPAGGGDTTFTGNSSVQCIGKGAASLTYNGTTTNQTGGAGGTGSTGDTTRTGGAGGAGANTSVAGWTKVQFASNTACTASSTTCAVTVSSTGTGHVLVAGIITSGTATAITISSVSGAGTWTLCTSSGCAINGGASFANLDLAYNLNSTSGVTSVTVTRNTTASSTGWKAFVAEYSFSAGSVAIDAVGVVDRTAGNAATKAGVPLSLSGSNDLCVQMIEANKNVSSVDSGFAIRTTTPVGYAFADAVAKTSCAETWTLASAGKSVHSALAIKLTGGGGTIFSGGGGEGACTTGTGNAGTTGATTGAGGTGCDGGDGGNGVAAGTAGANGTAPGGGGSGGYRDTSTSRDAGAGANGQLKITYTPSPKLDVALSSNVAASCATATTAQLAAPGAKTTADFTAGKICDDTASATVDIASGQYTELEWSLIFTSASTYDQVYQFRVTNAGMAIDGYDVTPSIVVHTPPVPALSSISPTSGDVGTTVAVTIHGADLDSGSAAIGVSGTGITVSSPVLVNATTMTANFVISSGASLGSRNVTVTTDTGTTNAVTFTVTHTPTFTAISPATATRNGTQSVTLTGTGLNVGSAAINVSGTGITVTDLVVQSSTQITADFVIDGTAAIGNRTVTITTVGGTSGPQTFAVTSGLAISSLTPSNAIRGSTLDVVIAGSSLNSGYMGGDALVAFSPSTGITINSTTVNSASQITVNITIDAAAAATARTATVTTDDGSTNGLSFTVTAPSTPGSFSAARMRKR